MAKELCSRLGWEYEKVAINWDAKDSELASGNINCIWNGFTLNGREDEYTWSDPYVDNSIVVVVKADSGIKTLADLEGKVLMATYQIGANDGEYVILDEAISNEQYAVGFLLGNEELRDAVNDELLKMAEDGTMMKIAENYVDDGLVLDSLCMCK